MRISTLCRNGQYFFKGLDFGGFYRGKKTKIYVEKAIKVR